MTDGRSPDELGRASDRHDADIREIRRDYIPRELFMSMHAALVDRVTRLEQADTVKSTGNRTWVLGLVQTLIGVVLSGVAAVLIARGGK